MYKFILKYKYKLETEAIRLLKIVNNTCFDLTWTVTYTKWMRNELISDFCRLELPQPVITFIKFSYKMCFYTKSYTENLVSRIPDCSGLCKSNHIILYGEVRTCWVNCSYLRKHWHCHHNGTLDCSHKCHHLLWLHAHILAHQLLHCTLALCSIISCQCTGVWGGRWHVDIPQCYQLH